MKLSCLYNSQVLSTCVTSQKSKIWLNNWKPGVIEHNKQQDESSCGIHVIEVSFICTRYFFFKN